METYYGVPSLRFPEGFTVAICAPCFKLAAPLGPVAPEHPAVVAVSAAANNLTIVALANGLAAVVAAGNTASPYEASALPAILPFADAAS